MGRSPCCSKEGLNRGAWTALEDKILTSYIKAHGEGKWRNLPKRAGLKRCGKSCRLRWLNYLRPNIKRGNISQDEEDLILRLHKLLGNRWSLIAARLPGRTDNEIKNYWNTTLAKKASARMQSPSHQAKAKARSRTRLNEPKTTTEHQTTEQASNTTTATTTQVIRTKATRCTKVFVSLPPINDTLINSNPSVNYPEDSLKFNWGPNQELDAYQNHENFLDFGSNDLSFDEQIWKDNAYPGAPSDCLQDDVNLDLESLTFLLDCEEWP